MEPARGANLTFDSFDAGSAETVTVGGVAETVGAGSAVVAKDGTYSVSLPPGTYTVNWAYIGSVPSNVGRGIDPRIVEVSPGENGRVDFVIDTGIR